MSAQPTAPLLLSPPPEAPFTIQVDNAPRNIPADSTTVGEWESDVFGCCYTCCDAWLALLLPCISACLAVDQVRGPAISVLFGLLIFGGAADLLAYLFATKDGGDAHGNSYYYDSRKSDREFGYLVGAIICWAVYALIVALARNCVRTHYRIPGKFATDCGAAVCCSCCAVAQIRIHTRVAEVKAKTAASTLPAYTSA